MHEQYSQRTSLMVVSVVGCIALWMIVIAFSNMNDEVMHLDKEVTTLKMQVNTKNAHNPSNLPVVPTPPSAIPPLSEPQTPPPSGL